MEIQVRGTEEEFQALLDVLARHQIDTKIDIAIVREIENNVRKPIEPPSLLVIQGGKSKYSTRKSVELPKLS